MGDQVFVLILTILIGSVRSFEEGVPSDLKDASSIEDSVLDQIRSWWQEMSVQKPMNKCEPPKEWIIDSPLLKLFNNQMPIVSDPCGPSKSHLFNVLNNNYGSVW